mmetsp:Transcript_16217/g.43689  ORF Transcript_16217/g.43689 Transcript_16217/m.43689 type:complete len:217 (-) Transcript_16217:409-1059(-)
MEGFLAYGSLPRHASPEIRRRWAVRELAASLAVHVVANLEVTCRQAGIHALLDFLAVENHPATAAGPIAILRHSDLAEVDVRGEADDVSRGPHAATCKADPIETPNVHFAPVVIARPRGESELRDTLDAEQLHLVVEDTGLGHRVGSADSRSVPEFDLLHPGQHYRIARCTDQSPERGPSCTLLHLGNFGFVSEGFLPSASLQRRESPEIHKWRAV